MCSCHRRPSSFILSFCGVPRGNSAVTCRFVEEGCEEVDGFEEGCGEGSRSVLGPLASTTTTSKRPILRTHCCHVLLGEGGIWILPPRIFLAALGWCAVFVKTAEIPQPADRAAVRHSCPDQHARGMAARRTMNTKEAMCGGNRCNVNLQVLTNACRPLRLR